MRPWIVSAVAVAILVAGTLVYLDRQGDDPGDGGAREAATRPKFSPLSEAEVRQYLAVMPQLNLMLGGIAEEFQKRRIEGKLDEKEFGTYSQQRVAELLSRHHLTPETFDTLRRRVEYVVDVLRYEEDLERRHKELDRKIAEKERHLEMMKDPKGREMLQQDLVELKRQRAAPPPPLHVRDRELVKSFWRDLQRVVPKTAPLPEDRRGDATPPPR